ncbi:MAG: SRPBCC domain-containing protein [Myxococcota bacterium]
MAEHQSQVLLSAPPAVVYDGWITPAVHGHYAEAFVKMDPRPEGRFELWGGAVRGQFIDLQRPKEIRMTWRTVDFLPSMSDSKVRLQFQANPKGCRLLVTHQDIPEPMLGQFRFAWEEYYLPKMQRFYLRFLT